MKTRKWRSFADSANDNEIESMITSGFYVLLQSSLIPFLQVLQANTDQNSVVLRLLSPTIKARYIRVHPQTWYGHISMRIELLGCPIGNNSCLYNFCNDKFDIESSSGVF